MPLQIPNAGTASFPNQARLDSGDLAVIAQGLAGDGVISGCAVTAQGLPNMTVAVAAGYVRINSVGVAVAAGNVTITSNSTGSSRVDLVVVNGSGTKSVIAGTPGAAPLWPSASGYVILARLEVPSGVSAITSSHITDKRAVVQPGLLINVKDYGAKGDGVTDDTTAIQAAITAAEAAGITTSKGATVLFPPGHYITSAALTWTKAIKLQGSSRWGTIIQNNTTDVFNPNGNGWSVESMRVNGVGGHIFAPTGAGNTLSCLSDLTLIMYNPAKSIWYQSGSQIYIDMLVQHCDLYVDVAATAPGWQMLGTISGLNANTWQRLRLNGQNRSMYFFDIEESMSSNFTYDNSFVDINAEQCPGGIIKAMSAHSWHLRNVGGYDVTTYTSDIFYFGKTATGANPWAIQATNCGRRGGALTGGVYDFTITNTGTAHGHVLTNVGPSTGNPVLNVPSSGVTLLSITGPQFTDLVNFLPTNASAAVTIGNGYALGPGLLLKPASGSGTYVSDILQVQTDAGTQRMSIGAGGWLDMVEQTAPAAPAADTARLFARDDGSGGTQVAVRFPTGSVIPLATQGGSAAYTPGGTDVAVADGGTGASTAAAARVNLGVDGRSTFSDAAYSILATDVVVEQIGTLSAPRTATLPAASAVNAGRRITLKDASGTVTTTNTLTLARAGSDAIDGQTSVAFGSAYAWVTVESDGTSKWSIVARSVLVDRQVFTASGTWNKPSWAGANATTRIDAWGGGGGGGAGRRGATTTLRIGGGGGQGGACQFWSGETAALPSTLTVTVGAAGSGGTAATTDDANGGAGTAGTASTLVNGGLTYLHAYGGSAGAGGTNSGAAAGGSGATVNVNGGTSGAASSATGAAGSAALNGGRGGGSGGSGGGLASGADVATAGGSGSIGTAENLTAGAGGAAGASGTAGTNANLLLGGSGGGGGGSNAAGAGGTGGAGGNYGAGGGGGGASLNGSNSGAGGSGAGGLVVVVTQG